MKKTMLTLFCTACLCAAAALKPGYVRHGDLKPSDQVPGDYETVMSNYLATAGYVPSHSTNTVTIVSNVTVNTDHWHTNNVVTAEDHWVTNNFVHVSNIVTHTDHFITNNVTHNFTQSFEHWHTNNYVDVTNRYFYDTLVTTNEIWNVGTNVVYEPHYIVSNITERVWTTNEWVREYYNNVYVTNHYTDVINNLYTNVFTTVWSTNNLVTWATNVIYETTNLYVTTHEDHYVTNSVTLWVTNNVTTHTDHWVTNNLVDYTTHWVTNNLVGTNTTHEVQCVVSNFYDVVYETTNIYNNVYETTNIYNNVYETNTVVTWATSNIVVNTHSNIYLTTVLTNREDYYVYLTEVTTNEVMQLRYITNVYTNQYLSSTNYYTTFLTDRITATNLLERHEIDAVNKLYYSYRQVIEPRQAYWESTEFGHRYSTNPVAPPAGLNGLYERGTGVQVLPMLSMGSDALDALVPNGGASNKTGPYARFYGLAYPCIVTNASSGTYTTVNGNSGRLTGLLFEIRGGWLSVQSEATNFVTATTSPSIGSYLYLHYGGRSYNVAYPSGSLTADPTFKVLGAKSAYVLDKNLGALTDEADRYYFETDGKFIAGSTGTEYNIDTDSREGYFGGYQFAFNLVTNAGNAAMTTNWVHYASELVDFNDMARYGEFHTANEVVTSAVFRTTMEDAMLPYTYASYTNMTMAASYARKTMTDAAAISNYMNTADQKIAYAIATSTDIASGQANLAMQYRNEAQGYRNEAVASAVAAQTNAQAAAFQYDLIQTFTNWFYAALNAGQVVTNINVYTVADWTARFGITNLQISVTNSIAAVTNSIAAVTDSIAAATNRIAALENSGPPISITDEGVMTYPGDPRYIVPMTLKENNFTPMLQYHQNKTFTFGCIRRGPSSIGGTNTVQICYRNEDYPNSTLYDWTNFCSYDYGLTFLWNKGTGKWRILRKYGTSDSPYAFYSESYGYVTNLNFTWTATLNSRTVTYTPTTTSLLVNTPCTADLATQAELNAEATARSDADTAEATARLNADTAESTARSDEDTALHGYITAVSNENALAIATLQTDLEKTRRWSVFGTRCIFKVTTYRSTSTCVANAASADNPAGTSSTFMMIGTGGSGNTGVTTPSTYTISNLNPVLKDNATASPSLGSKLFFTVTYNNGTSERDFVYLMKKASDLTSDTTITLSSAYVYYVTSGSEASPGGASSRGWRLTGTITLKHIDGQ